MNVAGVRVPRWLTRAYVMVAVFVLAWVLLASGPELLRWRRLLAAPGAYAYAASWISMAALLGGLWALMLRWAYDVRLGWREWLPLQALAWGGRYLPGKVGLLAGKALLAGREGMGWRRVGFSVLYEQIAFVVSGFLVALLLLSGAELVPENWRRDWLEMVTTPMRLAVAALGAVGFALGLAWVGGRMAAAARLEFSRSIVLLLLYLLPHALVGTGAWLLLTEIVPAGSTLAVTTVIGVLALAHAVGVLAIFAPAGLGVRELVLAAGLAPLMPLTEALAFATLLRLLSVVADGLLLLLGLAIRRGMPGA
jgi:glycosyltransferase 2 family protein